MKLYIVPLSSRLLILFFPTLYRPESVKMKTAEKPAGNCLTINALSMSTKIPFIVMTQ